MHRIARCVPDYQLVSRFTSLKAVSHISPSFLAIQPSISLNNGNIRVHTMAFSKCNILYKIKKKKTENPVKFSDTDSHFYKPIKKMSDLNFENVTHDQYGITFQLKYTPSIITLISTITSIPLVYATLMLGLSHSSEFYLTFLQAYSAIMLAANGSVHTGLALVKYNWKAQQKNFNTMQLWWGVIPQFMALSSLCSDSMAQFLIVQVIGYAACIIFDIFASANGWAPKWFPALKGMLVLLCIMSLITGITLFVADKQAENPQTGIGI